MIGQVCGMWKRLHRQAYIHLGRRVKHYNNGILFEDMRESGTVSKYEYWKIKFAKKFFVEKIQNYISPETVDLAVAESDTSPF